jgi:DNA-binding HxlR family transcriptional regulator
MKPSAHAVFRFLERKRRWVSVREILVNVATNTPTKRLSELYKEGFIHKRRKPDDTRYVEYRIVMI